MVSLSTIHGFLFNCLGLDWFGPLFLKLVFNQYNRNLVGYTNILVYGNEVLSGCSIIANGTPDADAVITIDFGQGSCKSGNEVALSEGSIFIDEVKIVTFGTAFKDIIFAMSDCDDVITIAKTYTDTSSVEVLGYGGNDRIILGDSSRPIHNIIFANIIIDGGRGKRDVLRIQDQGSSKSKPVAVRPTTLTGIHGTGSETISYFGIENINLSLGSSAAQVNVYSTAKDLSLTLTTQDSDDSIIAQNVQGPLKVYSGCGDDYISLKVSILLIARMMVFACPDLIDQNQI